MSTGDVQGQEHRPRRRTSGRRQAVAPQQRLAELTAARDRLDAAQVDRRKREDAALLAYAATIDELDSVAADRDRRLADVERQREAIHADADARLEQVQRRQAAVLVQLNDLGRSADELAALVGLPVKQVRTLLRTHRATAAAQEAAEPAATSNNPAPAAMAADGPVGEQPSDVAAEQNLVAAGAPDGG